MANEKMNDNEMNEVSGGAGMPGVCFSGLVAPGQCIVGRCYYVVKFNNWYYAELVRAVPGRYANNFDYTFHATQWNGVAADMNLEVSSVMVEVYTTKGVQL